MAVLCCSLHAVSHNVMMQRLNVPLVPGRLLHDFHILLRMLCCIYYRANSSVATLPAVHMSAC